MATLKVHILFGYQDSYSHRHRVTYTKTFELENVPSVPCHLQIDSKIFRSVKFDFPSYDHKNDLYIIKEKRSDGISRYARLVQQLEEIHEVTKKCISEGWEVKQIK